MFFDSDIQLRENSMIDIGLKETATPQTNVALIKAGYDAFACGDVQGAIAGYAPDIFWHVPGRGPLSRDYRGHAEVLDFFGQFMKLSNGTTEDEFWSTHV
jgi:ketosteroid isomerase-like protein